MNSQSSRAYDRELTSWFNKIKAGELKLPRFQRHQAWDVNRIASLLETIISNLPLGVALILEVGDKEQFASRYLATGPKTHGRVLEHLLDGQQRLTALWRTLHNNYEDYSYYLYLKDFDVAEDNISNDDDSIHYQWRYQKRGKRYPLWSDDAAKCLAKGLVPLELLRPDDISTEINSWIEEALLESKPIDTTDEKYPALLSKYYEKREKLLGVLNKYRERIKHYNLPYLSLPSSTPKDVALTVFINMNTNTKPLSTYDIIVAEVESETGMSLHEMQADLDLRHPEIKEMASIDYLILSTSALLQDKPPYNRGFLSMSKSDMTDKWPLMESGLVQAVRFLQDEGVFSKQLLPTSVVVGVIGALYSAIPNGLDQRGKAEVLLRRYLWSSFFTDRYDNNPVDRAMKDYKTMKSFILGLNKEDGKPTKETDIPVLDRNLFPIVDLEQLLTIGWPKKQNIKARAILCVAAKLGSYDLADGSKLTEHNLHQRDYHHIFPRHILGDLEVDTDLALNCMLISSSTNKSLGAKTPFKYIQDRYNIFDEETINFRLSSHLVPIGAMKAADMEPDDKDLLELRYRDFLKERAGLFRTVAVKLCDGRSLTIDQAYSDSSQILPELKDLNERISGIELATRKFIAKVFATEDHIKHAQELIPIKSIEAAQGKYESWQRKNPGEVVEAPMTIKTILDNMSLSEYADVIVSKRNWNNFESVFISKGMVLSRFQQLATCRNRIRHDNYVSDIERKDGEAAVLWFSKALRNYL